MANQRIIVPVANAETLADAAAARLMARIDANPGRIAICLTGGSGPKRLYHVLATPAYRDRIPWQRTHWFIGDDRFVPTADPLSNIGIAKHAFLDVCAPRDCVHPMPTDAATPDAAANLYDAMLKVFHDSDVLDPAHPLFDLVLMGMGPDGHTASLFPGYPAVAVRDRWVTGVPEAHVAPFVPRVTLTLPALASCREMLFLVSGAEKRDIVAEVLAGGDLPAAQARSDHETVWLIDDAARPDHPDAR